MATFNAGAIEATLELDRTPFQQGISLARAQGQRFAAQKFTAKLDVDAGRLTAEIARLEALLTALGSQDPTVDVDADTAAAHAQISALQARLAVLENTETEHTVDVNTTRSRIGLQLLIGMGAMIGPALIPGITGATAALGAMVSVLGAAGGGLAVLGAGMIGNIAKVTGAQKDLTAAQDAGTAAAGASAAAQEGVRSALRGVQAAERGLADARLAAAGQVAAAEGALTAAHERVRRAQEDLTRARVEAKERLEDLRESLTGAALDEEGSELAVRRARLRLQEVMADPESTMLDKDEAKLAYDRALYQMRQTREERDELQKSWKEESAAGVKGSREVVAAREQLRDAQAGVRDAEAQLAQARRDGARQVADAQRNLADAHRQVAAAQEAAATASAGLATATADQGAAMAAMSSGPAVAFIAALDAAKGAWQDFLKATEASSLGVATRGLELFTRYLPFLPPAADAAAEGVQRLFDRFDEWAAGGGMQGFVDFLVQYAPDAIEGLGVVIGNLIGWLGGIGDAFAPFAMDMLDELERITAGWRDWASELDSNPGFDRFLTFVRETGPLFLDTLGSMWDALLNIGEAMAPAAVPVLVALRETFDFLAGLDPTQLQLLALALGSIMAATGVGAIAGGLIAMSALVALLSDAADKSDRFAGIMSTAGDVIGDVFGWLQEKGRQLWQETLKPGLEDIARVLEDDLMPAFSGFWELVEPIGRWLAEELFNMVQLGLGGALQFIKGGLEALAGVFNVITGLFTGDWSKLWKGVKQIASGAWQMLIGAAKVLLVVGLGKIIGLAWRGITALFRIGGRWVRGIWDDLWKWVKGAAQAAWRWLGDKTRSGWDDLSGAFSRGVRTLRGWWNDLWGWIRDKASDAYRWLLDKLGTGNGGLFGKLGSVFRRGVGILREAWSLIREAFANPVKFVIDRVINDGVIAGYNWIARKLPGVNEINDVPVPDWLRFSKGTSRVPGIDTGGDSVRAMLRPNEAVLVPGAADALGRDTIDAMNANPDKWTGMGGAGDFLGWVKKNALESPVRAFRARATGAIDDMTGGMTGAARLPVGAAHKAVAAIGGYLLDKLGSGALRPEPQGITGKGPATGWQIPVRPYVVTAGFPNYASGEYHGGVDLAGPSGTPVYPINAGRVVASYDLPGSNPYNDTPYRSYGRVVEMAHGGGITSLYAHLEDRIARTIGKAFAANEAIGLRGSTGNSTGPHVHLEVESGGRKIDPLAFLRGRGATFDGGGILNPGNVAFNASNAPEPVLTADQWNLISGYALDAANAGHQGTVTREDIERMIDALREVGPVTVQAPTEATGREIVDLLGFELRATGRGGVHNG